MKRKINKKGIIIFLNSFAILFIVLSFAFYPAINEILKWISKTTLDKNGENIVPYGTTNFLVFVKHFAILWAISLFFYLYSLGVLLAEKNSFSKALIPLLFIKKIKFKDDPKERNKYISLPLAFLIFIVFLALLIHIIFNISLVYKQELIIAIPFTLLFAGITIVTPILLYLY